MKWRVLLYVILTLAAAGVFTLRYLAHRLLPFPCAPIIEGHTYIFGPGGWFVRVVKLIDLSHAQVSERDNLSIVECRRLLPQTNLAEPLPGARQ